MRDSHAKRAALFCLGGGLLEDAGRNHFPWGARPPDTPATIPTTYPMHAHTICAQPSEARGFEFVSIAIQTQTIPAGVPAEGFRWPPLSF